MSQSNDDLSTRRTFITDETALQGLTYASDHPILNLTAQEKTAYSYLFNLADSDSLNVVTGERAVAFFEKTSVPAPVLGEIWQVADTENRGLLTKAGFCMVLRLIGWYQNGQTLPTTELAFKPAPLPRFDGITLPGAAASPSTSGFPQGALQPQLSGQNTGQGQIRVPPLDPAKVQQYSGLFSRSGAQNGILDAGTAKSIFERAGLPNEVLGKIWALADREQRGALDETEFIVAMHLLTCMNTRAMTALPNNLPQGLYEAAARRGQRPPSRQASGQAGTPAARQLGLNTVPRTQSPLARPPSSGIPTPVQSAQPTGTPWLITPQEKSSYDRYFNTVDTAGRGTLSGEQAVQFFSDSRLPEETLASIWDLADINSEGHLNKDEFAVAMYLIRQQRAPNAQPLPAFLPAALVPPSMRPAQQPQPPSATVQQPQASALDNSSFAPPLSKSAADDLFGLDSSPTQAQSVPQQPTLQPQGTGASATRDPFAGSQQGSAPASPARFQQTTGGTFKPFIPTSAFGASLASQNTGGSATSSQGQPQRGPSAPMPSAMDDLLGDNETNAAESRNITNESTELANMSNQIGNLRTQMEATQTKKTATQADVNATSAQKKDLEQRLQQFRGQYETEVRTVKELEQQLTESRESTKKLNQELAMLEGSYQDLQTQHNTISQQLQADQQENASLKQRISKINAESARLKPEIEKMKMDARQQKGLVSINKKQLATNEAERDRLQSDKADLEQAAAEQARSVAASPEPVIPSQASNVVSPVASTVSSTNPFFRKQSQDAPASPPPVTASGPTPSAFDTLFGPSSAFAPTGQTGSRSATPPATSFIGRSVPTAETAAVVGAGVVAAGTAGAGALALADSKASVGEPTPSATPPLTESVKDVPLDNAEPPPPPEADQFAPTHLPIIGGALGPDGKAESDAASSTMVMPPASRAGGLETPREAASSPPPFLGAAGGLPSIPGAFASDEPESKPEEPEREMIPGAFPADAQRRPSIIAREVASGVPSELPSPAPAPEPKPADEFESAFATFGEGEKSTEATTHDDPFAPTASSQPRGYDPEFPPIQNLEPEEDSDSGSDYEREEGGFDDNFTTASPPRNGEVAAPSAVIAPTGGAPDVNKDQSPPTYETITDATQSRDIQPEPTSANSFPTAFESLLPARDDPTSPPPPPEDVPRAAPPESGPSILQQPFSASTSSADVFVDAFSRPTSHVEEANIPSTAPPPAASKNVFDEFDDFNDLSEAQEADKTGSDADFSFWRPSQEEFNPVFDSPGQSATPTPMKPAPQESNGSAIFAPGNITSSGSAFGSESISSIQQTPPPQNTQHDWDEIFSGLDNSKNVNTSFDDSDEIWQPPPGPPPGREPITTNGSSTGILAPTPQSASAIKTAAPNLGRAITPGTEHDDPILKRLTGMGYPRSAALNALEMYDYDINKAVDHLSGS